MFFAPVTLIGFVMMTLIYEVDLDILKIYLRDKIWSFEIKLSTVWIVHTDRQADSFAGGNDSGSIDWCMIIGWLSWKSCTVLISTHSPSEHHLCFVCFRVWWLWDMWLWDCMETAVVVYSNSAQEHLNTILYTGFVEELVDILELKDAQLTVSL